MEDSIFTKIINGIIPCYKIAEDDNFIAFLDINPLQEGHTLVVPKIQIDYIYDLPDDILSELFIFSKIVAKKIENAIKCQRIGVARRTSIFINNNCYMGFFFLDCVHNLNTLNWYCKINSRLAITYPAINLISFGALSKSLDFPRSK